MRKKKIQSEIVTPVLFHEATKEQMLEFFTEEMKSMYWAEQYLYSSFSDLRYEFTCPHLQRGAIKLLRQYQEHSWDILKVFQLLHLASHYNKCEAIEQLVSEYQSIIGSDPQPTKQRDVCVVFVIQKILHFKIAVYSSLVQFATLLDNEEVLALVNKINEQEKGIDLLLTSIAERTLLFEVIPEP